MIFKKSQNIASLKNVRACSFERMVMWGSSCNRICFSVNFSDTNSKQIFDLFPSQI